ncbi:MAG: PadR family transcriptional regulator [Gammaproteobacteria bacterium]|nr:PadR family transcriptional regulator [Gammaproteobacteria bacterium]
MRTRENKTKYAILGMLSFAPKSGYEISKAIKNSTAFFWSESDGQLYPLLKRLSEEKMIQHVEEKVSGKRAKKMYEITKEGKAALVEWLHQEPNTFNVRNEFLLQLFFGRNIPKKNNIEKIKEMRDKLKKQLSLFNSFEKKIIEKSKEPKYLLLSLSYGQYSLKAEIAWCNDAIKLLEKKNV